jgi:polyferredoxin
MFGAGFNPIQLIGIIYAITLSVIAAYLWATGRFSGRIRYILLIVTILLGFATFSPMIPHQFQSLFTQLAEGRLGTILIAGIVGLGIVTLLAFLFGRHFCGYLCPIGALQEAAYTIRTKKINIVQKNLFSIIRLIFLIAIPAAAYLYGIELLNLFGFSDFFRLTLSISTLIFLLILIIGISIYRPFCRLICPVGAILQAAAMPAIYRIRRTDACIKCGRCEKACPTGEAKEGDLKGECYLCRRCIDVCPQEGALTYTRKRDEIL